jgi:2-dehydropantoate 2-reductase
MGAHVRICIFGAGAVGGHLAAKLAAAGHDVSLVARGAQLAAIQAKGLTLLSGERRFAARVRASDRPVELGTQDIVISTLKACSLGALAAGVGPLLGPETAVAFAQNGIPWWYAYGLARTRPKIPDLSRLDPGGALARAVGPARTLGAVIYSANAVREPGVIFNGTPADNRLIVAETDDNVSPRIERLRATLDVAGIASPPVADIRQNLWSKLLWNMTASMLALLTEQPVSVSARPPLTEIFGRLWREALAIARAHGIALPAEVPAPSTLDHKPSILQDYELGRPMEIEALLMAPLAFARVAGVPTPTLDVIAALAARRAADKGLYAI